MDKSFIKKGLKIIEIKSGAKDNSMIELFDDMVSSRDDLETINKLLLKQNQEFAYAIESSKIINDSDNTIHILITMFSIMINVFLGIYLYVGG